MQYCGGGIVSERHLYVPKGISWDAQLDRAHKIVKHNELEKVVVHKHEYNKFCDDESAGCVTIAGEGGVRREDEVPESTNS